MNNLARRDFLKLSGAAAVAGLLAGCCPVPRPTPALTGTSTARVATMRGDDLYAMTRDVLETLGGIQKIVNPGETVFIKPNMVTLPWASQGYNPFRLGECTKPEIVIAVVEECLKAGAAEVIVGDGSQMPRFDWKFARTLDGSTNLVAEAARLSSEYEGKVTIVCLDADTPGWIEVPTGISLGKVAISSLVVQADRVISIPVAKTHTLAVLTLSMKNLIGIIPLERYGWHNGPNYDRTDLHRHDYTSKAVNQLVFDLTQAVKPDLAIVDFSIGVEGNGPTTERGSAVDVKDRLGSWLLLASTDPVAADATAARVMNHDAAYVDRILTTAHEQGLGEMREEEIEIVGERLDELRVEWLPAKLDHG